jgi:uncharacterized membrane protein YphA (DoxX/SURF4 family)
MMARSFSVFPGGKAGAGLLALRFATAATLLTSLAADDAVPVTVFWLAVVLSVMLLLGVVTRYIAIPTLLLILACATCGGPHNAITHYAMMLIANGAEAVSLTLLGAGAYSIDARLFGRRVIHVRR